MTRVCFGPYRTVTLLQNENENLSHLTALHTLRDLEISCVQTFVLVPLPSSPVHFRAPVAEEVITNLPPLPPGLTRLAFSHATRVAFGHPLPQLRVLDWRGSFTKVPCMPFWTDFWDRGAVARFDDYSDEHLAADGRPWLVERDLDVPLAIPSAEIAPNLHTLLIGYKSGGQNRGEFDLWTLVAAGTALRVVVIERAHLLCGAPDGFDTTTAGFAALLEREAKDLVSVHTHDCVIEDAHQAAAENCFRALEQRGGRVCRAGADECLFCMLHDGTDMWPRWW